MTIPPSDGAPPDPYATPSAGASQDPKQPQQPNPAYPPYVPPSYGQVPPPYGQQPYPAQPNPQQPYGTPPPYGTGYPSPYGGYAPGYPGPQRRNGLAVASMWTSIGGIVTCGLAGFVGLVLGIVALHQIRRDGTAGRGMAIAGIVVGAVFILFFLGWVVAGVSDFQTGWHDGWDEGINT